MRMGRAARGLALAAVLAATTWAAAPALAEDECAPYPIGRCGAYDRERVIFCYRIAQGLMVSDTAPATTVHQNETADVLHIRTEPTEAFAADFMNAPLPFQSVYQDTNYVQGLQMRPTTCAMFEWWAECDSWMGPYNEDPTPADTQLV